MQRVCEVRWFPSRYIESVKSLNGRELGSNRKMREAFRAHFRDRFAHCSDPLVQEFRSYLADFSRLREAEEDSCEFVQFVMRELRECAVRNALKQIGFNKSSGLDGLPNEVYLRLLHMFVPILTDMFNHWFA